MKESLFNIIQFEIEGRSVLDLFGGTGQLGIEALSRGAERCTFVDARREAAALIRENLKATGLEKAGQVVQGDAISFLSGCRERFGVIFLDPPYQTQLLEQTLELVSKIDILSEHGIMICESPAERELPRWHLPMKRGGNTGTADQTDSLPPSGE